MSIPKSLGCILFCWILGYRRGQALLFPLCWCGGTFRMKKPLRVTHSNSHGAGNSALAALSTVEERSPLQTTGLPWYFLLPGLPLLCELEYIQ